MSHIDICVRLISHEIILPSPLRRNPLDSTVQLSRTARPLTLKLPTSHLFEEGNALLVRASPRDTSNQAFHMSCTSVCCLQQPADTRGSTCPLDGSSAILESVGTRLIQRFMPSSTQSSNKLQVWVHHSHCVSGMQSASLELHHCQYRQQVELLSEHSATLGRSKRLQRTSSEIAVFLDVTLVILRSSSQIS